MIKRDLASSDGELRKALTGRLSTDSDTIQGHWSSSIINKHIDRLLSGGVEADVLLHFEATGPLSHSVNPVQKLAGSEVDPSTQSARPPIATISNSNSRSTNAWTPGSTGSDRAIAIAEMSDPDHTGQAFPSPNLLIQPLTPASTVLLQLPGNFWKLLDVYYTYTHSWLPISEKNDMLKIAYSYPAEGLSISPGSAGSGMHAELWAIIALATQQSVDPSHSKTAESLMRQSRLLVATDHGSHEVGHVKALLILSMVHLGKRDWAQAWLSVGDAVRIALLLDLYTLASSTRPASESGVPRCRHIILACFVLESIIAMYVKKPAHLTSDLMSRIGPIDEDGLEEWTPWDGTASGADRQPARTLSTFNSLVALLGQGMNHPNKEILASNSINTSPSPQLVHLKIIAVWRTVEDGSASTRTLLDIAVKALNRFLALGGVLAVPPTFVPLLERLLKAHDSSAYRNILSQPAVGSLFKTWSMHIPEQSFAVPTSVPTAHPTQSPPMPRTNRLSRTSETFASNMHAESLNAANTLEAMRGSDPATRLKSSPQIPNQQQQQKQPRLPQQPLYNTAQSQNVYNNNANINDLQPASTSNAASSIPIEVPMAAYNDQLTPDFFSEGGTNPDFDALFEEIAMLEGSRHAQDGAQFMQNLGVGPDLDLSTFFGADYQASDPMLAYLQPGINNNNFHGV